MFKVITVLIHIINLVTILYMIFKEKRSANNIIAWTLVLYLAPFIGFIVFILIGRKMNKANMFGFKNAELKIFENYTNQVKERESLKDENIDIENIDMIRALEATDYSPYRSNNDVYMYSDGTLFFEELLTSLKKAKQSINIEFYIFKNDNIGTEILNI